MKILWDPGAREQLMAILHTIGGDDPLAAAEWLDTLEQILENVAAFPRSGRVMPEHDDEVLREIIHGSYRIAYIVRPKAIEVLAVWHSARRPPGRGIAGALEDE